ncbi:hypothetical protein IE077_000063 [Cardiosporidium cionae]|uniref:Protein kinase domain-containing protein n=1 Tax=Cardiosporidium cionae TaxID=476202 RepID=A0ABQ7JDQ7_9APIC|nr:hypothetical protein IE077_000063 [Cardiosporidium cionae]|eukprot:KAF8822094.1 hypothetical protein IE077_000063 [Cardiosporidium cionae]
MKSVSQACMHEASCRSTSLARHDEGDHAKDAGGETVIPSLQRIEKAPRLIWNKYTQHKSPLIRSSARQASIIPRTNSDMLHQYNENNTKRYEPECSLDTEALDLMDIETHKLLSENDSIDISLCTITTVSTVGSSIEDNGSGALLGQNANAERAGILANSNVPRESCGRYGTSSPSFSMLHIDPSSGLLIPPINQIAHFLPSSSEKSTSTRFQTRESLGELEEIEHENQIKVPKLHEKNFLRYRNEENWSESQLSHRNMHSTNWMGVGAWVAKLLHGKCPEHFHVNNNVIKEKAPLNDRLYPPKLKNLLNYQSESVEENDTMESVHSLEQSKNKFREDSEIYSTAEREESINHASASHNASSIEQIASSFKKENGIALCKESHNANPSMNGQETGRRPAQKGSDCSALQNVIIAEENQRHFCISKRFFDPRGPVAFFASPRNGMQGVRGELRLWHNPDERVIGQNSSKRRVHKAHWLSSFDKSTNFPAAIKFVEDCNSQDGRSLKREIECHLYIYEHLLRQSQNDSLLKIEDAWPCSELFGYYLDKKHPGNSVLITRKLSGPDFFNIIRFQHSCCFVEQQEQFEYHKLRWCILALEKVAQYSSLGIRHNDIKPDNIVLDLYTNPSNSKVLLDVKIIDLGTASLEHAKDYTGGTSWYESPEQRRLEYFTKKSRNLEEAKKVEIGLKSDTWGAGLSVTEVLLGRRVVDCMKDCFGIGPLEYRGHDSRWAVEPSDWVIRARQALGIENELALSRCGRAARFVYDCLVQPEPDNREPLSNVIETLYDIAEEAKRTVPAGDCHLGVNALTSELQAACRIVHP